MPRPPADATELRAIVDLRKQGWTREEIQEHLRISRRTYYRRLAQIRQIQQRARAGVLAAAPMADTDTEA